MTEDNDKALKESEAETVAENSVSVPENSQDHPSAPENDDQQQVQDVRLEQLDTEPPAQAGSKTSLDLIMDVEVPISVELGRKEMPIGQILELGPGSIVELDKMASDPVDLLVNNKLIARGEVVVVDENFGIRITVVVDPKQRARSLA